MLNLLVDIVEFRRNSYSSEDINFSIGYFLGLHFLLFIGLFLLGKAYKAQKMIKKNQMKEIIDSIGKP